MKNIIWTNIANYFFKRDIQKQIRTFCLKIDIDMNGKTVSKNNYYDAMRDISETTAVKY